MEVVIWILTNLPPSKHPSMENGENILSHKAVRKVK